MSRLSTPFAIAAVASLVLSGLVAALPATLEASPRSVGSTALPPSEGSQENGTRPPTTPNFQEEQAFLNTSISQGVRAAISLHPDFSFAWQTLLSGIVAGAVTGLCVFATGGVGSVGCLMLGLAIGAGLAAYLYFSELTALQSEASVLYGPAEGAFSQLLETLQNNVSQTAAIAANVGELTDSLTGLYGYEASAGSGEQLPSGSFNPYLDLIDSGVAGQMLSVVDGVSLGLWADLSGFYTSMDNLYGPSGRYGGDGLVCLAEINGTYLTSNSTYGQPRYFNYGPIPDVASANYNFGSDGGCNEDEGPSQIGVVTFAHNATGVGLPINSSYSAAYLATHSYLSHDFTTDLPLYIAPNATFDAAPQPQGVIIPLVSQPQTSACSGSAPCLQLNLTGPVTISGSGTTFRFDVPLGTPVAFSGVPGLYYLVNESQCDLSCVPADPAANYLVGTGVLPFEYGTSPQMEKYASTTFLGGASFETDYLSDSSEGLIAYACGQSPDTQDIKPVVSGSYSGPNLSSVNVCPFGIANLLPEVESEMAGAADIGQAYWTFLHGLGVYQESTIPASCVIPTPGDFLPPDTPLTQVIAFGSHDIANLMDAYVAALGNDYYSQTLDDATFCGYHLPPPGTITLNDPGWAFVGDIFTHVGGQALEDPSSWFATDVGMDILPQDGNLTIPVGSIWEAPAANPSIVYYGDTYPTVANLTAANVGSAVIDLSTGGVIAALEGNSTDRQGSIYPSQIDDRLGAGDALYLDACWHNESGTWTSVSACYDNVTVVSYIEPNGSSGCYFQGKCSVNGTGGYPLPEAGLDCGFFLATDFAAPFQNWGFNLGGYHVSLGAFACVFGWILLVVVGAIVLLIAIAAVKGVWREGTGSSGD
jgi:hypothetical protein